MMAPRSRGGRTRILILTGAILAAAVCLIWILFAGHWEELRAAWAFHSRKEALRVWISGFGRTAPLVFILLQVLQVILAPIPGEASGFIGGFLFGYWKSFLYSTIGLTLGSWINFSIARYLGRRYIRNLIPEQHLLRFDRLAQRRGMFIVFLLFLIPGFPKDYLCLFLGLTKMPLALFFIISTIGRMPGTLALSIQGASLYGEAYGLLALVTIICVLVVVTGIRYQESIYAWMERKQANGESGQL